MNVAAYLSRIGFRGDPTPSLPLLHQLQKSHLLSVPFENLDIHYGVPILLDAGRIFDKVVTRKRGGFCYELNGLFFELLTALGFAAKRISARVFEQEEYGREYDHLAVIVTLDGEEYLVDVGFGEFAFAPLRVTHEGPQQDARGVFVIDQTNDGYYRVAKIDQGQPKPHYIFKNIHRAFGEFDAMCRFHQTNPASHFTRNKLVSIATEQGRVTLTTHALKVTSGGTVEEKKVTSEQQFRQELLRHFAMQIPVSRPPE